MGPKARTILSKATDYDLSHANFPFMHSREINIAGTKVRATRLTYVGELGWEVYALLQMVKSLGSVDRSWRR